MGEGATVSGNRIRDHLGQTVDNMASLRPCPSSRLQPIVHVVCSAVANGLLMVMRLVLVLFLDRARKLLPRLTIPSTMGPSTVSQMVPGCCQLNIRPRLRSIYEGGDMGVPRPPLSNPQR